MSKEARYRSQCLFYALDKVHTQGGYINFGMSTHRELQHCGHYDNLKSEFTSFGPPDDLPQPWHSAFGYWGGVQTGDPEYRRAMPKKVMWRGILALVVGFWIWRVKRWVDSWPIP